MPNLELEANVSFGKKNSNAPFEFLVAVSRSTPDLVLDGFVILERLASQAGPAGAFAGRESGIWMRAASFCPSPSDSTRQAPPAILPAAANRFNPKAPSPVPRSCRSRAGSVFPGNSNTNGLRCGDRQCEPLAS